METRNKRVSSSSNAFPFLTFFLNHNSSLLYNTRSHCEHLLYYFKGWHLCLERYLFDTIFVFSRQTTRTFFPSFPRIHFQGIKISRDLPEKHTVPETVYVPGGISVLRHVRAKTSASHQFVPDFPERTSLRGFLEVELRSQDREAGFTCYELLNRLQGGCAPPSPLYVIHCQTHDNPSIKTAL